MSSRILRWVMATTLLFAAASLFFQPIPSVKAAAGDMGDWVQLTNMTYPRIFASVGIIEDRYLIVACGRTTARTHYVEQYDIETDTWENKTDYPRDMDAAWCAVIDDIMYVSGGYPASLTGYAYNRTADTWTAIADRPRTGWDGTTVTLVDAIGNEVMYCLGGSTDGNAQNWTDVYCPNNNTWLTKAEMNYERAMFAATTHDGKIYTFGCGWGGASYYTNRSEYYTPETDTWTVLTAESPTTDLRSLGKQSVDDIIYLIWAGGGSGAGRQPNTWAYNPATDTYDQMNDFLLLETPVLSMDNPMSSDNFVYVAGGREGVGTYEYLKTLFSFYITPAYTNPAAASVETWRFRSDTHTVNTVLGYKLHEDRTDTSLSTSKTDTGFWNTYVGFKVYVQGQTSATEISSGVVGVTYRTTAGEGVQNSVWTCPARTMILGFDAIKIELYVRIGVTGTWEKKATFITSRLMQNSLLNTTWTFSVYTKRGFSGGATNATVYWDSASYMTSVGDVDFDAPSSFETTLYYYQTGDFLMGILNPYMAPLGGLFWALPTLMIFATLYIRYQSFKVVLVAGVLFGGTSGLLLAVTPPPFSLLVGFILTVCIGVWLFKVIR